MPRIVFESCNLPPLQVDCPDGGRLLDICDEVTAPIPFSCRSATCGTCRVDVLEGAEVLDPPGPEECETLATLGDDGSRRRLACKAHVRATNGRLHLKPVRG